VIEIPASFRTMPRWWQDGTDWLDALPGLVAEQCRRWDLTAEPDVRHGSNALVVPVRRAGERLALRLSPPDDDVAQEEATLRFWDGRGTVRLVDADPDWRALLLEWISPGQSLAELPLAEVPSIVGPLLRRLAVQAPDDVPSTGEVISADASGWPERWAALGGR
jgi:streptomycin 6-kinase